MSGKSGVKMNTKAEPPTVLLVEDTEDNRFMMRRLLEMLQEEFEPKTWQAFQKFALEGVPAADVAKELGISTNAVFIAKSRVLARLRQGG